MGPDGEQKVRESAVRLLRSHLNLSDLFLEVSINHFALVSSFRLGIFESSQGRIFMKRCLKNLISVWETHPLNIV